MAARVVENKTFTLIESIIVPIGDTIILDKIDAVKPHCFAGVQFFADAQGETQAVPGAGTVTVDVETINSTPIFEAVPSNVIQAATIATISWAANTQRVRAVPLGITVATHYRLVVTCNET